MTQQSTTAWYQRSWLVITLLVIFFPAGLFLMWRYMGWPAPVKWSVTGVLAVLVILTVVGSAVGSDEEKPGEARANQATITATDLPDTPTTEPNSPTPRPTLTPRPGPTLTAGPPQLSAEECTYASNVAAQSGVIGDGLSSLTDLLTQVADDVSLIFDTDWQINVAVQIATMQASIDTMEATAPPGSMQNIHDALLNGLSKIDRAMDLLAQGIDNLDPDPIVEATGLMTSGTADITSASTLLEQFQRQRSGGC